MRDASDHLGIPSDCGVSIEFLIPSNSKRIDFIGPDLKMIDARLVMDPLAHPAQDNNMSGLRKRIKQGLAEKKAVLAEVDMLIRNTYRTLMPRRMKGTFIFCEDAGLQEYFRNSVQTQSTIEEQSA